MSQQQFSEFMDAQIQAIEASGMDPDQWVAECAEQFRQQWEESHHD